MQGLWLSVLSGLIRYVLFSVFSWMATNGITTPEQNEQLIVGLAGTVGMVIALIWVKWRDRILMHIGLDLPAGSTEADLKAEVSRTNATSIAKMGTGGGQ